MVAAIALASFAALSVRGRRIVPSSRERIRSVALAGAFGLVLYFSLLVLAAFNGTFAEAEGGLYAILAATPVWLRGWRMSRAP